MRGSHRTSVTIVIHQDWAIDEVGLIVLEMPLELLKCSAGCLGWDSAPTSEGVHGCLRHLHGVSSWDMAPLGRPMPFSDDDRRIFAVLACNDSSPPCLVKIHTHAPENWHWNQWWRNGKIQENLDYSKMDTSSFQHDKKQAFDTLPETNLLSFSTLHLRDVLPRTMLSAW